MLPEIKRSTSKSIKRFAWCGSLQDIERLAKIFEEVHSARAEELYVERKASLEEEDGTLTPMNERRLGEEAKRAFVEFIFTEGVDAVAGPLSEVLKEVDRRSVDSFALKGEFSKKGEALSISMTKNGYSQGVEVKVASSNPGWARQAFARLSEEVDKGVPRWNWVHSPSGSIFLSVATFCVLMTIYTLLVFNWVSNVNLRTNLVVFGITVVLIACIGLTGDRMRRWAFPSLEITGDGGDSTGGRRLIYILSYPVTIVLGVIVNIIS